MQKMRQAPVYFTLAQVRFNPILAVDSYVPKIQDLFRRQGFPDTQKLAMATFNLTGAQVGDASPQTLPVSQMTRYAFSTMEKTAGFLLDQGSLSYQTMEYDVFESFSATFLNGLKTVHEAVSLSYTDRIGLRYLDAVYPGKGEELSEYLNESVLGLYGKLAGTLVHAFSETRLRNGDAHVTARVIVQDGRVGFPPDLQPMGLELANRFQTLFGVHAVLDTDGAYERRAAFDLDQIGGHLSTIHEAVVESFKASVTPHAIESWE
jgi:uncharacterized protein (TIGR04255 family)